MNWLDVRNQLSEGKSRELPAYALIAQAIRTAIETGQLSPRSKLPTNRELSTMLSVDRSTVSRALWELGQEGYIDSHVGRGTFVNSPADRLTRGAEKTGTRQSILWSDKFSQSSSIAFELLSKQPSNPVRTDVISFAGGIPTEEFYPQQQFQDIVLEIARSRDSGGMFGYSPAEGHPLLRDQLRRHLSDQGIPCEDEELLIVSGSQQAIDLVTNVLVDPSDSLIIEDPSYFWAILNFRARQAKCLPVETDENGLKIDGLESLIVRHKPKLLYVMPSYQNPTGTTMPLERRFQLLDICLRHQLPILEDNFVGDLHYEGDAIPPLVSLPGGREIVIHQGTFSKALCPGLRLGWLKAPADVTARLRLAKRSCDLSTNSMAQVVLAKYLDNGLYTAHLDHVRAAYLSRRDTMLKAMAEHITPVQKNFPYRLSWYKPAGGLFVWVKLPDGAKSRELLTLSEPLGVTFSPGDMFFVSADRGEYFRLCFIQTDEVQIEEGIRRLSQALVSYFEALSDRASSGKVFQARLEENVLI